MREIEGSVAIVTGGAGGVGKIVCTSLANAGARIALVDNDETSAKAVVAELEAFGAQAIAIGCDIRNSADIENAVKMTVDWFGTVDILVNNPMVALPDIALEDMSDAEFDLAIAAGPTAAFRFMRACYPHLINGGRVINVRSGTEVVSLSENSAPDWFWNRITVRNLSVSADSFFVESHPDRLNEMWPYTSGTRTGGNQTEVGPQAVFLATPDSASARGRAAVSYRRDVAAVG